MIMHLLPKYEREIAPPCAGPGQICAPAVMRDTTVTAHQTRGRCSAPDRSAEGRFEPAETSGSVQRADAMAGAG